MEPRSRRCLAVAVVLLAGVPLAALAAPAAAQDHAWEGELHPGDELRLFSVRGDVTVTAAPGAVARVRATGGSERGGGQEVRYELRERQGYVVICALTAGAGHRARCTDEGIRTEEARRGPNAWAHFTVELPAGVDLRLSTGGGELQVSGVTGRLRASTGAGPVRVEGGTQVEVATGSGEVEVAPAAAGAGDLSVRTGSGAITLRLPDPVSARVTARTGSGGFHTDFPMLVSGAVGEGRLDGTIGTGARALELRTGSGSISLLRHP